MNLYDVVERNCFFTLTRKIVGNVLFLSFPAVLLCVFVGYFVSELQAQALPSGAQKLLDDMRLVVWGVLGLTVIIALFSTFLCGICFCIQLKK